MGFSWGVSEEIAKGIRLLELFGFPGIKNLNQYYKLINKKKFENLLIINKKNKSNKYSLCPINLVIGILDQIKSLEKLKKITLHKIAYPILLLPFLSRSSDVIGKKILFKFEKNTFLFNFNVNILSNLSVKQFPLLAKKSEIFFLKIKTILQKKNGRLFINYQKILLLKKQKV